MEFLHVHHHHGIAPVHGDMLWPVAVRLADELAEARTRSLVNQRWRRTSSSSKGSAHNPANTTAESHTLVSRKAFKTWLRPSAHITQDVVFREPARRAGLRAQAFVQKSQVLAQGLRTQGIPHQVGAGLARCAGQAVT